MPRVEIDVRLLTSLREDDGLTWKAIGTVFSVTANTARLRYVNRDSAKKERPEKKSKAPTVNIVATGPLSSIVLQQQYRKASSLTIKTRDKDLIAYLSWYGRIAEHKGDYWYLEEGAESLLQALPGLYGFFDSWRMSDSLYPSYRNAYVLPRRR